MAKKRTQRRHAVKANIQIHELTKAGTSIEFDIFAEGEKIGQIVIGRGSLTWFGKNRHFGKTISWSRFAELLNKHFYG